MLVPDWVNQKAKTQYVMRNPQKADLKSFISILGKVSLDDILRIKGDNE